MKVAIVVTLDLPSAEALPDVITHIDPPSVPYFDGDVRVVPEPFVHTMIAWLDEP